MNSNESSPIIDRATQLREQYTRAFESGDENAMKSALWDAHVHYQENSEAYVEDAKREMYAPDMHDINHANIAKVFDACDVPYHGGSDKKPYVPKVELLVRGSDGAKDVPASQDEVVNLSSANRISLLGVARIALEPSVLIREDTAGGKTRVWAVETYSQSAPWDFMSGSESNSRLADTTYVYELNPRAIEMSKENGGWFDFIGDALEVQRYLQLIADNLPDIARAA